MDNNHPIESLMKSTMDSIRQTVDVNTIVGDAITSPDGSIIIPVSKVCFGFASGGGEYNFEERKEFSEKYPFGGGTGAGVTVKPVAFLVIKNDSVRLLPLEYDSPFDKAIDSIPQIIEMIKGLSRPKDSKCPEKTEAKE